MPDDNIEVGPTRDADTGEIQDPASETGSGDGSNELGAENYDGDDVNSWDEENNSPEDQDDFNSGGKDLTDPEGFDESQEKSTKEKVKSKAKSAKKKAEEARKQVRQRVEQAREARGRAGNVFGRNNPFSREELLDSSLEDAREFARRRGILDSQNVNQSVERNLLFQSESTKETVESFAKNYQVEQQAKEQKEQINEQLSDLESSSSGRTFFMGSGENREQVSRNEAVSRLEEQKNDLSDSIEQSRQNQKDLADGPERSNIISYGQIEGLDRSDFQGSQEVSSQASRSMNTQYASGTNIPGQYSEGSPLSNREVRESFESQQETFRDVAAATFTPAGFTAAGALVDPEKTPGEVIEEKSGEVGDMSPGEAAGQILASPGGLVLSGGLGKAAGAGFQGLKSSAGSVGSRALSGLAYTGQAAGAGFVGSQIGKGAGQAASGEVASGVGRVLQVGSEAGAILKGFRSGARQYGPRLSGSTAVEQENVLRSVADDDTLRGVGRMEARTPVVRNRLRGGTEKVDEAVSTAQYNIEASRSGSFASGSVRDNFPGGSSEREFESISNVVSRDSDTVMIEQDGVMRKYDLNEDDFVTRDVLRTRSEGSAFRSFEDTSSTSISRKQGERPVGEIDSFRVVDNPSGVTDNLENDVVEQVRLGNIDAKSVEFSSYTPREDGEVFSRSRNLVIDDSPGGGAAGASGSGQGLQYGSRYGDGFVEETQRQVSAGRQFGVRSREAAEDSLQSQSGGLIASSGGSAGSGQSVESVSADMAYSSPQRGSTSEVTEAPSVERVQRQERESLQRGSGQAGMSSGSTEVTSTASQIIQNEKEDMLDFSSGSRTDSDAGLERNQVSAVGQDQRRRQNQEQFNSQNLRAGNVQKSRQFFGLSSRSGTSLLNAQAVLPQMAQQTSQALKSEATSVANTGMQTSPGSGRLDLDIPFDRVSRVRSGETGRSGRGDARGGLQTDWFSANLVEQKTGEKAVFDASSQARNPLFGLRAEQERSGDVEPDKIFDDLNSDGGGDIW